MSEEQALYDCAGRVVERMYKYICELVQYRDKEGQIARVDAVQIKRLSKQPAVGKHKYFYDNDKLVSEYIYDAAGNLIQTVVNDYDEGGRLVHSTWAEVDGDVIWEDFYGYDENGLKSEWNKNHYDVNDNSVTRYYYDELGRKIAEKGDSTLCGRTHYEYKYDTSDRIIEEAHYDEDGKVESKLVYTYDERGYLVKFETFMHEDQISYGQLIYERDERGNAFRLRSYRQHLVHMTQREYNKYGHVVRGVSTNYYCDCRGVRVQPYELAEYEYVYY